MPNQKTLILDFDDLHYRAPENCLDSIRFLVEKEPDIKLSFFTIAELEGLPLYKDPDWCKAILGFIESKNVVLGVHGLNHDILEFKEISKEAAEFKISHAEEIFEKAGLPFVKVFKGPHWGINRNTYDVLIDRGYTHVYSHEDYADLKDDRIKTVVYNWNLMEPAPKDDEVVGHGHTHAVCSNGIAEVRDRILDYCEAKNPTFKFIHEA